MAYFRRQYQGHKELDIMRDFIKMMECERFRSIKIPYILSIRFKRLRSWTKSYEVSTKRWTPPHFYLPVSKDIYDKDIYSIKKILRPNNHIEDYMDVLTPLYFKRLWDDLQKFTLDKDLFSANFDSEGIISRSNYIILTNVADPNVIIEDYYQPEILELPYVTLRRSWDCNIPEEYAEKLFAYGLAFDMNKFIKEV